MYKQVSIVRDKRTWVGQSTENFLLLLLLVLILLVLNVVVKQIVLNCTASLRLYLAWWPFLSSLSDVTLRNFQISLSLLPQSTEELVSAVSSSLKLDGISIADPLI